MDIKALVDRYVAVWNERDVEARRRRIAELWPADGRTCYRELDSRGHAAIEQRVASANEKWVRDGGFVFRPRSVAGHRGAVKLVWEMLPAGGGAIAAAGLSVLVLDDAGLIQEDCQFSEPPGAAAPEVERLVSRYVDFWNQTDGGARLGQLPELWTPDTVFTTETVTRHGHAGIEAEWRAAYDVCGAKGFAFRSAGLTDGHHDMIRMSWEMVPEGGGPAAATGFALLLLGEDGRIRADYQLA